MRFAFLLPAVLLATGCGVPDVTFYPSGGSHDSGPHPEASVDAPADAGGDAESDANSDAPGDAPQDASEPCTGDAGAPGGFRCCSGVSGVVCGSPMCSSTACTQCSTISCNWPNVCCSTMGVATCKPAGGC